MDVYVTVTVWVRVEAGLKIGLKQKNGAKTRLWDKIVIKIKKIGWSPDSGKLGLALASECVFG